MNLLRLLFSFLLLLLTGIPAAFAEAPAQPAAKSEPTNADSSGTMPLWELEMPSGDVLYIVGSIHLLKPDAYPLPDPIEAAFDASPEVIFETDIEALQDPALQLELMQRGMYSDGSTIEDHVSEETYQLYTDFLAEYGLPEAMFSKFKPWMAGVTASILAMQKAGYLPQHGLEHYFSKRAKEAGKPMEGLEEPMFQINLLSSFENEREEEFLVKTIEDLKAIPDYFDKMDKSWRTGDMDALAELMNEGFEGFPELAERLLYARNRDWAAKLDERIQEGEPGIVIVGAGHLAGEENLIELLREKGYTIEQQ